jgi:hypothetical protein
VTAYVPGKSKPALFLVCPSMGGMATPSVALRPGLWCLAAWSPRAPLDHWQSYLEVFHSNLVLATLKPLCFIEVQRYYAQDLPVVSAQPPSWASLSASLLEGRQRQLSESAAEEEALNSGSLETPAVRVFCTVCCAVLCCTILYSTVLYCTLLCCVVRVRAVPCCAVLFCSSLGGAAGGAGAPAPPPHDCKTAQHSTAQHEPAQHSTVEYSIAQ